MRYNFLPSFARRKGRITKLQETNLSFLADYSLDDPNTLNNNPSFDKIALEIGFGNGEDFFSFAKDKTNTLFLASEVYKSGIGNLIGKIREHSLENIYIHEGDIRDLIFEEKGFKFDEVYIIQPCLKPNSFLFLSTDWKNYAEQIQDVLRGFEDKFSIETIKQIPGRELSKFQKKGIKEGREIYNFKLSLI